MMLIPKKKHGLKTAVEMHLSQTFPRAYIMRIFTQAEIAIGCFHPISQ
jgi:hypothetical protein